MPKVSVIMNCRNCSKYLREALDSVYGQTFKDYEIIFWDNQSTDNSAEIALEYREPLKYFRGETSLSLGAARNAAIQRSSGEYIAFLDCDDKWDSTKLEKQVAIMESRPEISFVYSSYYRLEPNNRMVLGLKGGQPEGDVFERFLYYYPVNMQTVIIRQQALEHLDSLFDINLNLCEEYDVFMRVLFNGKAAYIKEPLAVYRIHPNMSSIKFKEDWPKELEYVIEKYKKLGYDIKYGEAMKYMEVNLDYSRAKVKMLQGDLKTARRYLAPYKWLQKKFFLLYIATLMPVSFWLFLRPLWARGTFR